MTLCVCNNISSGFCYAECCDNEVLMDTLNVAFNGAFHSSFTDWITLLISCFKILVASSIFYQGAARKSRHPA